MASSDAAGKRSGQTANDCTETSVAQAMITCATVHAPGVTVGELRRFFRGEHVHMALLVDDGRLVAVVERGDLEPTARDEVPVRRSPLRGRAIGPNASLSQGLEAMRRGGRRRLAVVDNGGILLGLLCLKASGRGFCSDASVEERKLAETRPAASGDPRTVAPRASR